MARVEEPAPEVSGVMLKAWKRLREIDGFVEGPSVFDESDDARAFYVDGTQVVNLRGPGVLELRLTKQVIRALRDRLRADGRIELRRNPSDWLTVTISRPGDVDFVVDLAQTAAEVHLPPQGVTRRPPPEGAELARRRRFH